MAALGSTLWLAVQMEKALASGPWRLLHEEHALRHRRSGHAILGGIYGSESYTAV